MSELNRSEWNTFLEAYPNVHLLQTTEWGTLKDAFGWEAHRLATKNAGAQILFRKLPLGFTIGYLPKGPVGERTQDLWPLIDDLCRRKRSVFLKVEPDIWQDSSLGIGPSLPPGFQPSHHAIQPPRTIIVPLMDDEDELLGGMKQKTRYNIRLAKRKGVQVQESNDLEIFQELLEITSDRDEFGVHSLAYYQKLYELFQPQGSCAMFLAYYETEPLGGVMVFAHGERAWYLHGASTNRRRNFMPNYLLQWKAIRWAISRGCKAYDLWGVPDEEEGTLEKTFSQRSDGLWGVYRFKRGFGGQVRRAAGPWDKIYIPGIYKVYQWWASRRTTQGGEG